MSRNERRGSWTRFQDAVVFLFTVGTGASALGGWTAGTAQVVLRVVAGIAAVYLIYLLGTYYRLSRENDLVSAEELIRDIEDVVTRQSAPNEESVQVKIIVGCSDEGDRVQEEVRVRPNPQVVNRIIRPVMPYHWRRPDHLRDIEFTCAVDESDDGPVLVRPRPMRNREYLQIWLIFTPTLTKPTVWRFQYRPRGLWRELRETGHDRLVWHDTMPSDGRSPMVDFRITFVFTDSAFKPRVSERNGYGTTSSPTRSSTGEWVVDWHDPNPQGRRYEWVIARTPVAGTN